MRRAHHAIAATHTLKEDTALHLVDGRDAALDLPARRDEVPEGLAPELGAHALPQLVARPQERWSTRRELLEVFFGNGLFG